MDKKAIMNLINSSNYKKGTTFRLSATTDVSSKLTAENKKSVSVRHEFTKFFRSGIDYENMKETKEYRDGSGKEATGSVNGMHFVRGYENTLLTNKDETKLYLSLKKDYLLADKGESHYLINDGKGEREISLDEFKALCKPSAFKSYGAPSNVWSINIENIKDISIK